MAHDDNNWSLLMRGVAVVCKVSNALFLLRTNGRKCNSHISLCWNRDLQLIFCLHPLIIWRIFRWMWGKFQNQVPCYKNLEIYASCALEGQGVYKHWCSWRTHHLASGRLASNPVSTTCAVESVTFEQDTKLLWESAVSAARGDNNTSLKGLWSKSHILKCQEILLLTWHTG